MLTRASSSIPVGKVDFALSGAAELGVERVHVHVHILTGKESKYVPLTDLVLKCAPTDIQLLFITNPELLIPITEVLMPIENF